MDRNFNFYSLKKKFKGMFLEICFWFVQEEIFNVSQDSGFVSVLGRFGFMKFGDLI